LSGLRTGRIVQKDELMPRSLGTRHSVRRLPFDVGLKQMIQVCLQQLEEKEAYDALAGYTSQYNGWVAGRGRSIIFRLSMTSA
jgi:hypothetical protein